MTSKQDYLDKIINLLGPNGELYFEHGYEVNLPINNREFVVGCNTELVFLKKQITTKSFIQKVVPFKKLKKEQVKLVYNELINYIDYVKTNV
jgi:hypothetical protein